MKSSAMSRWSEKENRQLKKSVSWRGREGIVALRILGHFECETGCEYVLRHS